MLQRSGQYLDAALGAIDAGAIARDASRLVRVPSVTGDERAAIEEAAAMADELGLDAAVVEHDLATLRAGRGYPGEEAGRAELVGATVTLAGEDPGAPRICLNGHVDVVPEGAEPWTRGPWSGAVEEGAVHGRGAVDMKGGVAAALHALAALEASGTRPAGDVVLQVVASEEDGGLGTYAALERDDRFAACLIPEPTDFTLVCAHAGALTFSGVVRGKGAHAAMRLEGVSAIDRYLPIHEALQAHERELNARTRHPLLADHPLPYPVLVGRVQAGQWSSQVPDELRFEGRLGVPVGESLEQARAAFEHVVAAAGDDDGPAVEIAWTGGQFGSGETALDDPWVALVREAAAAELGAPPALAGSPYGADMRQFTERGIPCVMFGPSGSRRAHSVDERVEIRDLEQLARTIVRAIAAFG
ncbi:MAG: acetylornithine deacetylase [Thermoleophilaceae bacterium]|jgi:acetylornithine deacetylase|nr:acetylornithine deacetylase [Thermoleophilaceae bacterium]